MVCLILICGGHRCQKRFLVSWSTVVYCWPKLVKWWWCTLLFKLKINPMFFYHVLIIPKTGLGHLGLVNTFLIITLVFHYTPIPWKNVGLSINGPLRPLPIEHPSQGIHSLLSFCPFYRCFFNCSSIVNCLLIILIRNNCINILDFLEFN